ncbi:hypothetical protein JNJ66_01640 [Candidatus Saccharibacteria bacterium]|nr:hypothetical protein [Candidatus Saccharibacteria bacterium]
MTIARTAYLTPTVIEVTLALPEALSFVPGQYIRLKMQGEWRAYSVAAMPDAFTVVIVAQLVDGGRASKEFIAMQPGDRYLMLPPEGWYTYHSGQPACFAGTGTGIIPCLAMIEGALAQGERKQLTLLFGARSQANLFYTDRLDALARRYANFTVVYALSRPDPGWTGYEGRVSDYLRQHFQELRAATFYVSAWHETVESLVALLLKLGVERSDLHSEYYD